MGFDSSRDILNLVISFCVLWITVFICWMFYYVMRLLRNANRIIEEFRLRLQLLTDTINHIRGKVEHISDFMGLASGGLGGLVKAVAKRKANKWLDDKSGALNDVAKDAVNRAMNAAESKIKKATKKIKK
jgi:hypothetical protein